jgi:pimeloyl-ACP methyl ester carboxylesterase
MLAIVALLLGGVLPMASTADVARAVVPFTPAPCPIAPIEGLTIDCGYLTVAESRRNYTGKTIDLAVAIMRSPNPNKAPDPAVFLQGGPGGPTLALAPLLALTYTPTLLQRDIILMDQRGTGYSRPKLDCALTVQSVQGRALPAGLLESDLPDFIQAQVDQLVGCGLAYRAAGVDLSAYNSVENAADYEDLRLALGYGPWNVIGASYGTRLALTMLRYRPETLRSVVLDSTYPLQANFHVDVFSSYNGTLQRLAAECAADAACNRAYPDLLATFDRVYEQLNSNPAQVPIIDPQTEEIITYLPISGVTFSTVIFQLFYSTPIISLMPLLIGETGNGNYAPLGVLLGLLLTGESNPDPGATQALGMLTAVQCNEDAPFASREDFVAARDQNRRAAALAFQVPFNEGFLDVCAGIGLNNPDPAENAPVVSDRPIMIISGTNDPITPPSYAQETAATLSNSYIVSYPRGGHAPSIDSPCLAEGVAAFIADPAARPDPSACIAQEAPLPFLTPARRSQPWARLLATVRSVESFQLR